MDSNGSMVVGVKPCWVISDLKLQILNLYPQEIGIEKKSVLSPLPL